MNTRLRWLRSFNTLRKSMVSRRKRLCVCLADNLLLYDRVWRENNASRTNTIKRKNEQWSPTFSTISVRCNVSVQTTCVLNTNKCLRVYFKRIWHTWIVWAAECAGDTIISLFRKEKLLISFDICIFAHINFFFLLNTFFFYLIFTKTLHSI